MQNLIFDSLMIALVLSGIPMVSIALASGLVALVQAATQIQEQSVTHLVRLITFIGVVFVAGDWMGGEIASLFERSVKAIASVGRGP
jgi:type III secretory pathway component EscS